MLKRTASLFGFSVRNHETTSHHSSPIHFTNKVMYTKNHVDNKKCQRSPSATHHHNIAIYVTMSPYEENHLHTCTRQSSCCHVSQRTPIKHCKEFWIFTACKESSTHPRLFPNTTPTTRHINITHDSIDTCTSISPKHYQTPILWQRTRRIGHGKPYNMIKQYQATVSGTSTCTSLRHCVENEHCQAIIWQQRQLYLMAHSCDLSDTNHHDDTIVARHTNSNFPLSLTNELHNGRYSYFKNWIND